MSGTLLIYYNKVPRSLKAKQISIVYGLSPKLMGMEIIRFWLYSCESKSVRDFEYSPPPEF